MKKLVSIVLVFIMIIGILTVGVYAASSEGGIMPYYIVVTGWSATLDKTSSTTAHSHTSFSTDGNHTIIGTMYLKRKEGTLWKTADSWTGTGTTVLTMNGDSTVSTGYTYKVYSVADVYDSDGDFIERVTASSGEVSY